MKIFQKRAAMLILVLLIWAIMISARLFFYTVYARDYYFQMGNLQAWRKGEIAPLRGRILDRNNIPLAWTEIYFDLYCYDAPDGKPDPEREVILRRIFKNYTFEKDPYAGRYLVKKDLGPKECQLVADNFPVLSGFRIESRTRRRLVDYPAVRRYIGRSETSEGIETGISGIEAQYNQQLTGESGEYIVMLDRHGNWIQGTWKMVKDPVPGEDVKLKMAVDEIIKQDHGAENRQ